MPGHSFVQKLKLRNNLSLKMLPLLRYKLFQSSWNTEMFKAAVLDLTPVTTAILTCHFCFCYYAKASIIKINTCLREISKQQRRKNFQTVKDNCDSCDCSEVCFRKYNFPPVVFTWGCFSCLVIKCNAQQSNSYNKVYRKDSAMFIVINIL